MSEATVRAQIKAILSAVEGIGRVHDYKRTSRSTAAFLELMRSDGIVNGWMISRTTTPSERRTNPIIHRHHDFQITGLYEIDDTNGSERTFQALVDAVYDAFKGNITINGTCENSSPIHVESVDYEEIAKTLYHFADLTLACTERDTYSL